MKTILLIVTLLLPLAVSAQPYSIVWYKTAGGGGVSTGGVYSVSGTIGQQDAAPAVTGGSDSLTGGYWALYAVQSPGAPRLAIDPATPGHARISWAPSAPGYKLQETLSLTFPGWTNSPSGSTNPVVVPATLPRKFYQLFKP